MKTENATIRRPETEQKTAAEGGGLPLRLLVTLALLSAIAPFATDLYLPAFPAMTIDLQTDATSVQLTLTGFLLGAALGQLAFGPLSDRFGRLRPLLIGVAVCVVSSVVAALAPTVAVLIIARFVQGFSGAAGMVIGRAVISDRATGQTAARAFSVMMMVSGIAPILAPFVGSLLVAPIGWRGILWVVAAIAAVMLVAVVTIVRETHPADRRRPGRNHTTLDTSGRQTTDASPLRLLRRRAYLGNTLTFAFAFAVMMAYISASPFIYQVMIGMTPVLYGLVFGATALGLLVVSALSAALTATRPVRALLGVGVTAVLVSTLVLLTLVLLGAPAWSFTIPIFTAVSSLGLILGNATALALAAVPSATGTGSAVLGALQFTLAALVSPLVGIGGEDTAVPLAIVMTSAAVIAVLAFLSTAPRAVPRR